jgi:hypothetical protein
MCTSNVDNLDDAAFVLIGYLNRSCSASSFYFTNESHTFNFNPSPTSVSVLKIRFLPVKFLKTGKSEQVRYYAADTMPELIRARQAALKELVREV